MPSHLVLFRIHVPKASASGLEGREEKIRGILDGVDGFIGFTLWQGFHDKAAILGVYEYASREAAEEGMRVYSLNPVLDEAVELSSEPMQIQEIAVNEAHGVLPHESQEGQVLSASFRIASPGLSDELQEDLDQVFDSLKLTAGYLGSIRGHLVSLEDEAVGLVLWSDALAFDRTVPARRPYEVQLYRRA